MSQSLQPPQSTLPKKNNWWFVLGREPELSAAEIIAVLGSEKFFLPKRDLPVLVGASVDLDPNILISQLGGTIKIAEEVGRNLTTQLLISTIAESLKALSGKIHFGLSGYGPSLSTESITRIGMAIKKILKTSGLSVRYVPNQETALSSATVDHNHLITKGREFLIREDGANNFSLAYTIALQPYENFSERDFGRPGRDNLSGMLPPKLAMMMINLAHTDKNKVLFDPFCGSGTIVTEAMLMGYKNIIGSDISEQAISDTKKNANWLKNKYHLPDTKIEIFLADATNLENKISDQSVDAIVAESFLGKPLRGGETVNDLMSQAKELKELYQKSFHSFARIIKPGGTIVFIFPAFRAQPGWIRTECAEEIEKLGYKIDEFGENKYLFYERPSQKLGREIWRFTKTS